MTVNFFTREGEGKYSVPLLEIQDLINFSVNTIISHTRKQNANKLFCKQNYESIPKKTWGQILSKVFKCKYFYFLQMQTLFKYFFKYLDRYAISIKIEIIIKKIISFFNYNDHTFNYKHNSEKNSDKQYYSPKQPILVN